MLFRAEAEIELAFNMDAIAAEPEDGEGEEVEGEEGAIEGGRVEL